MRQRFVPLLLLVPLLACETTPAATSDNPLPSLLAVSPELVIVGSASATVEATGQGFVSGSRARLDGQDRETHVQDDKHLTFTLTADDLKSGHVATVTIVNGPPGGGTSGEKQLTVGNPKPTVASISPTSATVGSPELILTVTGTGFTATSRVFFGTTTLATTFASETRLTAVIPASRLNSAATSAVRVDNPTPGGGPSNTINFSAGNPTPVITSATPDTVTRGVDTRITVVGSSFLSTSKLVWNGVEQTTSVVSATNLYADIKGIAVPTAGTATVAVANPSPGGGQSGTVTLFVREPAPAITGFLPASATAGASAGATEVTVRGHNFTTASRVTWNAQSRSTAFVDSTRLTVALSSADLATVGSATVVVMNGGSSGSSLPAGFPILPPTATIISQQSLTLTTRDLVADPIRGLVYAVVQSGAPAHADEVVAIDPATAQIVWSTPAGSDPDRLAISDDGAFLYVLLRGAASISRIDLQSRIKVLDIPLSSSSSRGEDIVVLKGRPRSIAVSLRNTCCSPRHEGVAVFDDATMRPLLTQGHTGSNRIEGSSRPDRLYGYNNETTEFGFRRILVRADGLLQDGVQGGISGFGTEIVYDGGFIFATGGVVMEPETFRVVGTIAASGTMRPDVANGRVHFLSGGVLKTMHYAAFTQLGTLTIPDSSAGSVMVRFGKDGLAIGGGTKVVFIRSGLIG